MSYSLSTRLPDSLGRILEQNAINMKIKKSELVRKALQDYFEQQGSEITNCHKLVERLSYVLIVLQNSPDEETLLWLREEVKCVCDIMTNRSASCDGSITGIQI